MWRCTCTFLHKKFSSNTFLHFVYSTLLCSSLVMVYIYYILSYFLYKLTQKLIYANNLLTTYDFSLKDVALAEQELRIKTLELTTYDGTLFWKISEWSKRRSEAQSNQVTSLYSPIFYSSKNGYKMCARLYPNGDGMGKNTHMSIFFVVMRGMIWLDYSFYRLNLNQIV